MPCFWCRTVCLQTSERIGFHTKDVIILDRYFFINVVAGILIILLGLNFLDNSQFFKDFFTWQAFRQFLIGDAAHEKNQYFQS